MNQAIYNYIEELYGDVQAIDVDEINDPVVRSIIEGIESDLLTILRRWEIEFGQSADDCPTPNEDSGNPQRFADGEPYTDHDNPVSNALDIMEDEMDIDRSGEGRRAGMDVAELQD